MNSSKKWVHHVQNFSNLRIWRLTIACRYTKYIITGSYTFFLMFPSTDNAKIDETEKTMCQFYVIEQWFSVDCKLCNGLWKLFNMSTRHVKEYVKRVASIDQEQYPPWDLNVSCFYITCMYYNTNAKIDMQSPDRRINKSRQTGRMTDIWTHGKI